MCVFPCESSWGRLRSRSPGMHKLFLFAALMFACRSACKVLYRDSFCSLAGESTCTSKLLFLVNLLFPLYSPVYKSGPVFLRQNVCYLRLSVNEFEASPPSLYPGAATVLSAVHIKPPELPTCAHNALLSATPRVGGVLLCFVERERE